MDNKLLNKVITISSEETKQTQLGLLKKIKDENNLTYFIFQTKQNGSESEAWKQYKDLNLGDTVQIGFVEQIKQTQDGKGYTARTIRNFNKDIGNGHKQYLDSQNQQSPRTDQNMKPGEASKDDLITRQVAFKGVIELMTAQILGGEDVIDVEKCVHKWTDKFSRIIKAQELPKPIKQIEEDLPVIQQEDVDVENIPF